MASMTSRRSVGERPRLGRGGKSRRRISHWASVRSLGYLVVRIPSISPRRMDHLRPSHAFSYTLLQHSTGNSLHPRYHLEALANSLRETVPTCLISASPSTTYGHPTPISGSPESIAAVRPHLWQYTFLVLLSLLEPSTNVAYDKQQHETTLLKHSTVSSLVCSLDASARFRLRRARQLQRHSQRPASRWRLLY